MNRGLLSFSGILVLVLFVFVALGQDKTVQEPAATSHKPQATRISELIAKLSSDDTKVYQDAAEKLIALGESVLKPLRKYLKEVTDPKIIKRVNLVIKRIEKQLEPYLVLKILAVNSSKKTQKIPIKAYLPKEVGPQDIINTDGLIIGYDLEKGLYFVTNKEDEEPELRPGACAEFSIIIKDIWFIPEEELTARKEETEIHLKLLENTPYYEKGLFLAEGIFEKLKEITNQQEKGKTASPQEHIAIYRRNLEFISTIDLYLKSLRQWTTPEPESD